MNPQKYTIQEFGAMVKEKYPEYSSYDDELIGRETLVNYPEYKNRIAEPAQQPNALQTVGNYIGGNIKDAATTLTTEFGGGDHSIGSKLIDNVQAGAADIQSGIDQGGFQGAGTALKGVAKAGLRTAGDVAGAIFAAPGAAIQATGLGDVFEYIGELSQKGGKYNPINAVTDMKSVQDFVARHPNLEADFVRALNLGLSGMETGKIEPRTIIERTKAQFKSAPKPPAPPAGPTEPGMVQRVASNAVREVVPTSDRIVNHMITKAFDLTPGDVKNISFSTGNQPGKFIAEHNLIGDSAESTIKNINDFYKKNYELVRDEISLVEGTFKQADIPRYREALTEIKSSVQDVPGLQAITSEVDALLRKQDPTLLDVQRVKEIMDDHFSLYKMTGDVKEGVAKQGLANIRTDIKSFIENRVKDSTGADIKALNNNVSTARSIADAIETRSTAGLTKGHIRSGDIMSLAGGSIVGGPLFGAALLFANRVLESPTMQLRIAKLFDGFSDSQKAKIKADLERGVVPQALSSQLTKSMSESQKSQTYMNAANENQTSNLNNDFIDPNNSTLGGKSTQVDPFANPTSGPMEMGTYKLGTNPKTGLVEPTGQYRAPGVNFYSPAKEVHWQKSATGETLSEGTIKVGEVVSPGNDDNFVVVKVYSNGKFRVIPEEVLLKHSDLKNDPSKIDQTTLDRISKNEPLEKDTIAKILADYQVDHAADFKKNSWDVDLYSSNTDDIAGSTPKTIPKGKGVTPPTNAYTETGPLTTKVLQKLEGRTRVSKQFIQDLTNASDLKQTERDLIRKTLKQYPDGKDVPVAEFANAVKTELLPLKKVQPEGDASSDGSYEGIKPRYENVTLSDDLRGNVVNYNEHIYESPISTSAGDVHFSDEGIKNYFAHTRIEDLPAKGGAKKLGNGDSVDTKTGELIPGDTRRVIELQSDLFQKGRLEKESSQAKEIKSNPTYDPKNRESFNNPEAQDMINKQADERLADVSKLEPYRNTWQNRIIREEVKQAALDGKNKLQFPTGETAMKIEGLGEQGNHNPWLSASLERHLKDSDGVTYSSINKPLKEMMTDLYVGMPVKRSGQEWVITDVLGDGKFKAVQKDTYETYVKTKGGYELKSPYAKEQLEINKETFDISGKVDKNNPIYKFYEKEVGRYLINNLNAKRVTDPQGVEWYEVPIKKEQGTKPIDALSVSKPGGNNIV